MGRMDGGRVVGGVFVAVVLGAVPAWLGLASAGSAPRGSASAGGLELAKPIGKGACVLQAEEIRQRHPSLLGTWRNLAVREGERSWRTHDGRTVAIDLTGTCLGCHGAATEFCDRCHESNGTTLACWGCHAKSAAVTTHDAPEKVKDVRAPSGPGE